MPILKAPLFLAPFAPRGEVSRRRNPMDMAWAVALIATLLLAACTPGGGPSDGNPGEDPAAGSTDGPDTVTVAYSVDIEGVNELVTQSTAIHTTLYYFALFLPLFEEHADYQTGPPTMAPRLSESYAFSDDRLTLTIELRQGVQWSDGVPVTAEDVRWTWQAQTSPEVGWPFAEVKQHIRDVEVVAPHTVRFHFEKAYSAQLLDVNMGVILPKHAWQELPFDQWRDNPQWFKDHLVVNGPFTLASHEPNQRYVLERNPNYFEPGIPKVDRVVFEMVRDPQAQLAMLRSGNAHYVEFVAPGDAKALEAEEDIYLTSYVPRFFYFVMWNTSRPLFAQKEVRQALTLAIDRDSIMEALYHGYAKPSVSPFTSDVWVHNDALEPYPYDPGRAKEMLAAQGFVDSDGDGVVERDGQPFRFELVTNSENNLRRDIVIMIQQQLKRVGIEVEPRFMEFNALFGPLSEHDFDAVVMALAMDTSLNTDYFFHTRGIDNGYNWGMHSNPELDQLIDDIEGYVDLLEAKPLFDRMQEIMHEEQPMTQLYQGIRLGGARKELQDVNPNAVNSFFNLRHWRLEDEG